MKKLFTLFTMCLLMATMAMAENTITFDASVDVSGNTTAGAQSFTKNGITFSTSKGILGAQNAYRIYKNETMTLTSAAGNIKKVEFTCIDKIGDSSYGADGFADAAGLTKTSNTQATWTGDAQSLTFTASGHQVRITKMEVTIDGDIVETVNAPTFSVAAGTYYTPINVEIKCGTAEANIYYTLDGTTPTAASTAYTQALAISENTTVKAIAIKGDKQSEVAEAAYVFETATPVANIAAYNAVDDNTMVQFANPVIALAKNSNNLYVMDDSGYALIYGTTPNYKNGQQVPAGFVGKKTTYNGMPELKDLVSSTFQAGVDGAEVAAEEIQCEDVSEDLWGHYVVIKGATISVTNKTITDNSGTAPIHTGMGGYGSSTDTTKTYDVYAIIGSYRPATATETIFQVLPVKLVDPNGNPVDDNAVANIAEYAALADNTTKNIAGDVTVYYANGSNLFVKDATGYLCIYGNTGQTYKNGDVIPGGFGGKKTTYNDGPEMQSPLTGFQAASANNPVAPEVKTTAVVASANWGQYVTIKNATISGLSGKNFNLTDAAGTVAGYNSFNVSMPADLTVEYDVTGIVSSHSGKAQLAITAYVPSDGSEITLPEVDDINALYQLNKGVNARIKSDLVAIYQNGSRLYVKNGETYTLVYGKLTNKFENGDIIRDAVANWSEYQGAKQIVPVDSTFAVAEKGAAVEPIEMPLEEMGQDMVHTYFIVKNAALTDSTITDETMTMTLFNQFNVDLTGLEEGAKYDVKCFLTVYKQELELYPVEVTKVGGNEYAKGDVNGDGNVDLQDINILINIMLNRDSADNYAGRANVDGLGGIDLADINAVINVMLGK